MAWASGSLPLFVCGDEASLKKASLPLFAFATSQSGVFSALPLYAHNEDAAALCSGVLPLYASGSGTATVTGVLSLFAGGTSYQASATLDLFALNQGVSSSLNLWASGQGTYPGAIPFSGALPLFLKRDEHAVLFLHVQAQGFPSSGILPLFSKGSIFSSGVLNLAMPSTHGEITTSLNLYSQGW